MTQRPRFERSRDHTEALKRVVPGGAHTYAKGDDQYPEGMAPIIRRGEGCRVWDVDGNEYVEFGSGLRSTTLGHGHPAVVEAVRRNVADGVNFVRPNHLELEAATALVDLVPSAAMVKFGLSGSDTNTAALKLARAHTGRSMVATCRQQPFFSTDDWFMARTPMAAGIRAEDRSDIVEFDFNDLTSVAQLFETHPDRIAAVFLEAEGLEPPRPGFFDGLRALCDRYGALLVLDEIITGFRWHERGAQHVYGIRPDLSTFGKAMANGLPLSALTGSEEIMRLGGFVEDRDRVFLLSQTGAAQPWALAALLAVIDVYQTDGIADRLHRIGADLRRRVDAVVAEAGMSDHFRVRGRDCNLIFATLDAEGRPSQALRTLTLQTFLEHGVLAPSFVVSAAHDDAALDQTAEAVRALMPRYRRALEDGVETVLEGRPVRPAIRARG